MLETKRGANSHQGMSAMGSAAYTFRLNRLHINSQRNTADDVGDRDYTSFFVTVNGNVLTAPASAPTSGPTGGGTSTGGQDPLNPFFGDGFMGEPNVAGDILLWDSGLVSDGKGGLTGGDPDWAIGPIEVADEDSIIVTYSVANLSHSNPEQATAEYLKLVAGEAAVLAGATALVPGGQLAGAIESILAGVLGFIGELLGWIAGNKPNCDGTIAVAPGLSFTGAQLQSQVNTPVPSFNVISQFTETIVNRGMTAGTTSGCGVPNTDVTWSILRDISGNQVFNPSTPSHMMKVRPLAASSSPTDWAGNWGNGQFLQNSRVACVISASGRGLSGLSVQDRVSSYLGGLWHSVSQEPMTIALLGQRASVDRARALEIPTIPTTLHAFGKGGVSAAPVTARFNVAATEHTSSMSAPPAETISASNLVEIPMLAPPVNGDVFPPDPIVTRPIGLPLHAPRETGAPEVLTRPINLRPQPLLLAHAASLVVSQDVVLQLYGAYDAKGVLAGRRIRYLRTSNTGEILTDVMLAPVQNIPT
jgi:hypothetical protein